MVKLYYTIKSYRKHWKKIVDKGNQLLQVWADGGNIAAVSNLFPRAICAGTKLRLSLNWLVLVTESWRFIEASCITCSVIYLYVGNKLRVYHLWDLKALRISLSTKTIIFSCFAVIIHRPLLSYLSFKIMDPQIKETQIIMITILIFYQITLILLKITHHHHRCCRIWTNQWK